MDAVINQQTKDIENMKTNHQKSIEVLKLEHTAQIKLV